MVRGLIDGIYIGDASEDVETNYCRSVENVGIIFICMDKKNVV